MNTATPMPPTELQIKDRKDHSHILTLPSNITAFLEMLWASDLWQTLSKMMSPIEYLLVHINVAILADSYISYDLYQRAANLL